MGLEAVFFVGAFILLVALIYGVLSYHYRNRALDPVREAATREVYRGADVGRPGREAVPPIAPRTPPPVGIEPEFSEDDIQRAQFGPRGVPGASDPARMTPQRAKKTPTNIDQGHVS
jgi:hypothetical protein